MEREWKATSVGGGGGEKDGERESEASETRRSLWAVVLVVEEVWRHSGISARTAPRQKRSVLISSLFYFSNGIGLAGQEGDGVARAHLAASWLVSPEPSGTPVRARAASTSQSRSSSSMEKRRNSWAPMSHPWGLKVKAKVVSLRYMNWTTAFLFRIWVNRPTRIP